MRRKRHLRSRYCEQKGFIQEFELILCVVERIDSLYHLSDKVLSRLKRGYDAE